MLEDLKYRLRRRLIIIRYWPKMKFLYRLEPLSDEWHDYVNARNIKLDRLDAVTEWRRQAKLWCLAKNLDIELPDHSDETIWIKYPESDSFNLLSESNLTRPLFTSKGRFIIRKAVQDEQMRRREVVAWWWKTVIIPAIGAVTGLFGAAIGLISLIHHR